MMEHNSNGRYLLFGASFLSLPWVVSTYLLRSTSVNIASGLVSHIHVSDIEMDSVFQSQETRCLVECAVLCVQTNTCLSVYYLIKSSTCNLNSNFLPQTVLHPSYVPSTVEILGWDPRGFKQNCIQVDDDIEMLCVNDRVERGPDWDWEWEYEDYYTNGTVTDVDGDYYYDEPGWVQVLWDFGESEWYRMGAEGGMIDLKCVCPHCFCIG